MVRRRKRLERQIAELDERVAAGELKVATLRAKQAGTDAARLEALAEKAGFVGAYGSGISGAMRAASGADGWVALSLTLTLTLFQEWCLRPAVRVRAPRGARRPARSGCAAQLARRSAC